MVLVIVWSVEQQSMPAVCAFCKAAQAWLSAYDVING